KTLPDFFIRMAFYPIAHLIYSIQVEGASNIPVHGPALIVANHVSHIDPILISAAGQRPIRFLMYRPYFEIPVANWFFRMMRCIPISEGDTPRAMLASFKIAREALKAGELVCIFAEGEITRHGQMLRFKKGYERLVRGLDVPIVPAHLDRVWGSIFSYERGRFLFKRPRRIPYPVTVSFGKPLPPTTPVHTLRQSILSLGADAFRHRLAERPPLPTAFLREAKRHPRRFAMADSTGGRVNYGQAMVRARLLGKALLNALPEGDVVAFLLPPSVPAALANIGVSMMGKVTANLNYTASPEVVRECAERAGAAGIVTSRRFLKKLGWEPIEGMIFIEDIAAGISKPAAVFTTVAMRVLPCFLVERLFLKNPHRSLDETATLIFTSGSTGVPKGVMLSHANILANLEALAQLYQVTENDRVLGVLPFFHSFGHTVTLWFPLVSGFGAIYHFNPLDAKRIGDLTAKHRATFLLTTPTFLLAYLRRIAPEKLKSLRYVVVGAEKLRENVAAAFEEKFGLTPLEGYGCTELAPVASVNIPDFEKKNSRQRGTKPGTIGHPLPGVLMKIVDPDTGEELPAGKSGMIWVKGPNVMKGYLGDKAKTDEVLRDGYYVTGDIGSIDGDGFVTITDRLSRFSKIAGEMVPHIRVEEKLHEMTGAVEQAFVVSAVPDPKRGERLIVLYKEQNDIEGLWKRLNDSDLPKLWVPAKDSFLKVEDFPLLGSGKLDMQGVKARARELVGR
ncbi:MAG: AMP-binding protein, partial [Elusimicrobiota bacterium]